MKTHFLLVRGLVWCGVCLGAWLALGLGSPARAAQGEIRTEVQARTGEMLTGMLPMPTNAPVALFRTLLQLSAEEQSRLLAGKSERSRAVILRKVQEYQAMPERDREARLQALEFHHYARLMLTAPVGARSVWLAQVPLPYRRLCEQRLQLWSVLPPEVQNYMREREGTLQWLTRWESATGSQRDELMASLSPDQRQALERDFSEWTSMTSQQRDQAWRSTRHLLEMSPKEQQKVLASVSDAHRASATRFVKSVGDIPTAQRNEYLEGCLKFARLDPRQRARLLMGWERWKGMSEAEREVWRQLAVRVQNTPVPQVPDPALRSPAKG